MYFLQGKWGGADVVHLPLKLTPLLFIADPCLLNFQFGKEFKWAKFKFPVHRECRWRKILSTCIKEKFFHLLSSITDLWMDVAPWCYKCMGLDWVGSMSRGKYRVPYGANNHVRQPWLTLSEKDRDAFAGSWLIIFFQGCGNFIFVKILQYFENKSGKQQIYFAQNWIITRWIWLDTQLHMENLHPFKPLVCIFEWKYRAEKSNRCNQWDRSGSQKNGKLQVIVGEKKLVYLCNCTQCTSATLMSANQYQ